MLNKHTSLLSLSKVCLSKVVKTTQLEQNNIGKLIVFVRMFEIVNPLTNFSRRI